MIGWLFALGGSAAGAAQAGLLARSARERPGIVFVFLRLSLVSAVLFLAARAGYIGFGTVG